MLNIFISILLTISSVAFAEDSKSHWDFIKQLNEKSKRLKESPENDLKICLPLINHYRKHAEGEQNIPIRYTTSGSYTHYKVPKKIDLPGFEGVNPMTEAGLLYRCNFLGFQTRIADAVGGNFADYNICKSCNQFVETVFHGQVMQNLGDEHYVLGSRSIKVRPGHPHKYIPDPDRKLLVRGGTFVTKGSNGITGIVGPWEKVTFVDGFNGKAQSVEYIDFYTIGSVFLRFSQVIRELKRQNGDKVACGRIINKFGQYDVLSFKLGCMSASARKSKRFSEWSISNPSMK